jgi:hypothetical protein
MGNWVGQKTRLYNMMKEEEIKWLRKQAFISFE